MGVQFLNKETLKNPSEKLGLSMGTSTGYIHVMVAGKEEVLILHHWSSYKKRKVFSKYLKQYRNLFPLLAKHYSLEVTHCTIRQLFHY